MTTVSIEKEINSKKNISDLITHHLELLNALKDKKLEKIWLDYKQKKVNTLNYDIFDKSLLHDLREHGNLILPPEIAYFYTEIGCKENDLTGKLKAYQNRDKSAHTFFEFFYFFICLSEEFAQLVLRTYFGLSLEQREALTQDIIVFDRDNFRSQYSSEIAYLLQECATNFSYQTDSFQFDFLQNIYRAYYHPNLLIKSLCIWQHCGGCGTIILNTDRIGFDSGAMWGYFLTTQFEGVDYEYQSNYYRDEEEHHLEKYRQNIETDISFLVNTLNS